MNSPWWGRAYQLKLAQTTSTPSCEIWVVKLLTTFKRGWNRSEKGKRPWRIWIWAEKEATILELIRQLLCRLATRNKRVEHLIINTWIRFSLLIKMITYHFRYIIMLRISRVRLRIHILKGINRQRLLVIILVMLIIMLNKFIWICINNILSTRIMTVD